MLKKYKRRAFNDVKCRSQKKSKEVKNILLLRHYDLQTQTDPIKKPLMIEQSY